MAAEFGRRITARRRELGLSRRDVAEASGLSYPYVSQLETSTRTPSRKSVAMLAHALRLDPTELAAAIASESDVVPRNHVRPAVPASDRDQWIPNPAYGELVVASRTPVPRQSEVVEEVTRLVSELPVDQRLDALHRVQREVLDRVVAERAGRTPS